MSKRATKRTRIDKSDHLARAREKMRCKAAVECIIESEFMETVPTGKLAGILEAIELTEREKAALKQNEKQEMELSLTQIPMYVWDDAVKNSRFASTPHLAHTKLRDLGAPVQFGKKLGRTFNLLEVLDWVFNSLLTRKSPSKSADPTAQMIDELDDPEVREKLKVEYLIEQIREKRLKNGKLSGELAPVDEFAARIMSCFGLLRGFGETLKRKKLHDELEEHNRVIESVYSSVEMEERRNEIDAGMEQEVAFDI